MRKRSESPAQHEIAYRDRCCSSAVAAVRVALIESFQKPLDSIADHLTRGFLGNEAIQQPQVNLQRKIVVSDFDSSLDRCAQ